MQIKLIVHNIHSRRDVYGNVYWLARLTSTATGHSALVTAVSDSNTRYSAKCAGLEWGEFTTGDSELPIRQFNAVSKEAIQCAVDKDVTEVITRLLEGEKIED